MIRSALFLSLALVMGSSAETLVAQGGYAHIFAKTKAPEDIDGTSNTVVASWDNVSGKFTIRANNKSFAFPIALMQDHFNENFMESDKFPRSSFDGQALGLSKEALDAGKPVSFQLSGLLDIHGVKLNRTISATLQKQADGSYVGNAKFPVVIADHKIDVPMIQKAVLPDQVDLTVKLIFKPTGK